MTILRNGRLVGEHLVSELDRVGLVRLMLGKELGGLAALAQTDRPPVGATVLRAQGVGRRGGVDAFDLDLHAGEVVGSRVCSAPAHRTGPPAVRRGPGRLRPARDPRLAGRAPRTAQRDRPRRGRSARRTAGPRASSRT